MIDFLRFDCVHPLLEFYGTVSIIYFKVMTSCLPISDVFHFYKHICTLHTLFSVVISKIRKLDFTDIWGGKNINEPPVRFMERNPYNSIKEQACYYNTYIRLSCQTPNHEMTKMYVLNTHVSFLRIIKMSWIVLSNEYIALQFYTCM